jgi:small subunit ribosomal protein S16
MLKIRLQRVGKKNSPSFRVVLVEHTAPPKGKFQEILGFYNPIKKEKNFKKERIEYWISKGVQISPTVYNLLVDEKIITTAKIKAWQPKKKPAASPTESGKQASPPASQRGEPQSESLGGEEVKIESEEKKEEEKKEQ